MTPNSIAFDHWIRNSFVEMNTELEFLYKKQPERINVHLVGDGLKKSISRKNQNFLLCFTMIPQLMK